MQLSDTSVLDQIGTSLTPKLSDFAEYMVSSKPLLRHYSWFNGGVCLTMTTLRSFQPIISLANSDAWLAGKNDQVAIGLRVDRYLAVASLAKLTLNDKHVLVPGSLAETWRTSDAYDAFVGRLNPDQFELVVATYTNFRSELDELRKQLTSLA